MPVVYLNMALPLAFAWWKDHTSPSLARFIGDVRRLPEPRMKAEPGRSRWPATARQPARAYGSRGVGARLPDSDQQAI